MTGHKRGTPGASSQLQGKHYKATPRQAAALHRCHGVDLNEPAPVAVVARKKTVPVPSWVRFHWEAA